MLKLQEIGNPKLIKLTNDYMFECSSDGIDTLIQYIENRVYRLSRKVRVLCLHAGNVMKISVQSMFDGKDFSYFNKLQYKSGDNLVSVRDVDEVIDDIALRFTKKGLIPWCKQVKYTDDEERICELSHMSEFMVIVRLLGLLQDKYFGNIGFSLKSNSNTIRLYPYNRTSNTKGKSFEIHLDGYGFDWNKSLIEKHNKTVLALEKELSRLAKM